MKTKVEHPEMPLSKSANPLKTGDCSTVPPSEPLFGEDSVSAIQNTLPDDFSGGHSQHRRNRSQMSNPGDGNLFEGEI
jgi:hypothetical protein